MPPPNVLMVGTGEYTTGLAPHAASDKQAGVVALTLFDLRRQGVVGRLSMAGTRGIRFAAIRQHLHQQIAQRYRGLEITFDSFPSDDVDADRLAYRRALEQLLPGDLVTVFTPDDTHVDIALAAIERGCHVLVAKPLVQTLHDHQRLIAAAERAQVLVAVEYHKRWDPMYRDARDRIRLLGNFGHFVSYMSQPKSQLQTFAAWAGKSSDISYYLNSHHIDFHLWALEGRARPIRVHALGSAGWAKQQGVESEDTITLCVTFEHPGSRSVGTAIYTSSWIAPASDVHSQQRFFYQGHCGEVQIDQAHRGYSLTTDAHGYRSVNPLFMKYAPDASGNFVGQDGYGYRSIADFVATAIQVRSGELDLTTAAQRLAVAVDTLPVTAILEAGRMSLDAQGSPVRIDYDPAGRPCRLTLASPPDA